MEISNDFFVKEEEKENEVKSRKPVNTKSANSNNVPNSHIPIKLSSLGKLTAPKIIHVRNYNGQEALDLAQADQGIKMFQTLLNILDNIIYEDFKSSDLHQKEMEEILLNITLNWWSKYLLEYPYPFKEEELKEGIELKIINEEKAESLRKRQDRVTVNIPIQNIETKNIPSEFKEPITVKSEGFEVKFRLPRVGDLLVAENYIIEKYTEEDNNFSTIKSDIDYNLANKNNPNVQQRKIDSSLYEDYLNYRSRKNKDYASIEQGSIILSVNGEEKNTPEEKIASLKEIPADALNKMDNVVKEFENFGPQKDVKIISPITKTEKIRGFQFRAMDYLQALELQDDSKYTVLFG